MEFRKYQHIERLGSLEVEDILLGTCYVFPKIDGTNSSIYINNKGDIKTGSRTRELTEEKDNANFYKSVLNESQFEGVKEFITENPEYKLFGEWLVPHSLKTYRDETWRNFYLFDMVIEDGEDFKYLKYEEYQEICEKYNINYIPCLKIIKNPTEKRLYNVLAENDYLIKDGEGSGEGIVIKNYDFTNRFGRTTWAKIVTSEFKEKHKKVMGASEITEQILPEYKFIEKYCTEALIEKTYSKIINDSEGWASKFIPRLLETVFRDLVVENTYDAVNKLKLKRIDFNRLKKLCQQRIKQVKTELF